jgi:hypothetical protein
MNDEFVDLRTMERTDASGAIGFDENGTVPLGNRRHEEFALRQARGESGTLAYEAIYAARGHDASTNAARLRSRPDVKARIRHLQTVGATEAVMQLREILEFLTRVKRTPVGLADAHSDVVRCFRVRPKGRKKVRLLDKLTCVRMAAKLQGFLRRRRRGPLPWLAVASAVNGADVDPTGGIPLRSAPQEAVARLLASGREGTEAYLAVYGGRRQCAIRRSSFLQKDPQFGARVRYLRAEAANGGVMDLQEILEFLTRVKRTPPGEVHADHELAEAIVIRPGFEEIWMPRKLACVGLAVRLLGLMP